ncbi:hypothetical protein [Taibaiella chishuiensis]|uniref:Lipoprotein n=1 Tax=Taibaiella chishuiensis TaxID=1434707 RepID=A0A2P8DAX3_9BACT|nr:hypothetical protein [Taibaiella chishuiensis]PSK94341.1 hypothetical protein B0I18_101496 [Taibaiella chishuiensis]
MYSFRLPVFPGVSAVLCFLALCTTACKQQSGTGDLPSSGKPGVTDTTTLPTGKTAVADTTTAGGKPFPLQGKTPGDFIPAGYEAALEAEGFLDKDPLPDYVMVLNKKSEPAAARACLVLTGAPGGGYRLAHTSYRAVQPAFTPDGYPIYDTEDMGIKDHTLLFDSYSPGPAGNLSAEYRYENNSLVLVAIHTYNMGAGSHTEISYNPASGLYEQTVTNTMTDSMSSETTTGNYRQPRLLFEDASPLDIIHQAYDKANVQ